MIESYVRARVRQRLQQYQRSGGKVIEPCAMTMVRSSKHSNKIRGYIAIWGSSRERDCVNTWFDRKRPPNLGIEEFLPLRLMYEHGEDPSIKRDIIGKVSEIWYDDRGIGFKGELRKESDHYYRVKNEILQGKLATSSASAGHLATFDKQGRFEDWLLSELTLTGKPCERKMPRVEMVRSVRGHLAYIA